MKLIKTLVIAVIVVVAVGIVALASDESAPKDTKNMTATIHFNGVPVDVTLDTYKASTKLTLVIASDVRLATHLITLDATGVSPEVEQQKIEQALLKQAGVVITHLEGGRASVTYNDRLELQP